MEPVGGLKKGFKEETAAGRKVSGPMVELIRKKSTREGIRDMGPALALLLGTLIISTFVAEFTFTFGLSALWKTLFRFLRLSLLLTLPLLLLPTVCTLLEGFFNHRTRHLIHPPEDPNPAIGRLKNWIIRPFQGIGLAMLLATKLLTLLEIYSGSKITLDSILPQGGFHAGRFISSIGIGVGVSLLLSFLWAMDHLGVRYYNRKTGEVRMIGRYLGLLLPIVFGFYGIISLFDNNARFFVAKYVAQMVVVLYPPFVIFTVIHFRYLKGHGQGLLRRLKAVSGGVMMGGTNLASSSV
jgi:hypothetical protein